MDTAIEHVHTPTKRAPLQYFGGKSKLAKWICEYLPAGCRPYVEPFCGAASVLFYRAPAPVEVINDIDGDIVNLFRVLRDPVQYAELQRMLALTPYARAELELALTMEPSSPVERAWRTMVLYNFSISAQRAKSLGNWRRNIISSACGCAKTVNDWVKRTIMVCDWHQRLMRVQIDNRDAIDVIQNYDNTEAVFYIDPPYHPETRSGGRYVCEIDGGYHRRLVDVLLNVSGSAVLSGYACAEYERLERAGWRRVDREVVCHAAGSTRSRRDKAQPKRIECLWINPKAQTLTPSTGKLELGCASESGRVV